MLCVNATCLVSNYHICELCIAILLQDIIYVNYTMLSCCKGIIYVNYAMPCCLANHHVCELYHAIIFLYYVFHLSTKFVYSTTLPMHQPFEAVMEVSGVKTRYSEQTMLPAEADILLVTESSSEEDLETDDQSYFPLKSMLKLGRVILPMSCMLLALLSFYTIYGLPSAYLLTI